MKSITIILALIIYSAQSSPLKSIRKAIATAITSSTVFIPLSSYASNYANHVQPSKLDDYLVRDIDFAVNDGSPVRISLIQGFASLKGKKPAVGGGDRTGTYTWPGGIELGTNIINHRGIDVRGKRVIELGTGTGVVGLSAVLSGAKEGSSVKSF